jgi:excinuclease ABC subunit C
MVGLIVNIQYIVTNNETESLILENDLIKKYQPKYNILLKDDKNFLYIKITRGEYPQVIRTRISPSNIKKSDGKYFGPYISGYHVQEIFKLLKKVFGYGVGSHNFFMKK